MIQPFLYCQILLLGEWNLKFSISASSKQKIVLQGWQNFTQAPYNIVFFFAIVGVNMNKTKGAQMTHS